MCKRIIFSLSFVTGMFFAGGAHAQLFLEDAKKVMAVSGGEHLSGSLTIHNTAADQSVVRVYWEDFEYKAPYDGSKKFLPAGTAPGSASQWVSFTPQEFTLPGMGQQKIDYTVDVPANVQGGHYGVLFFEKSSGPLNNDSGLTLVTRVGCLFFIEAKDKNKSAALQNIKLDANGLKADFVNQGNVVLIPHVTYYIMQQDGVVSLRGEINKLYVPEQATAPMVIPFKDQLKQGNYTLVLNADLDDGDVVVKEIGLAVDASGQINISSES